jgi:WD40 repeat protein/serine/threonine protein kinase
MAIESQVPDEEAIFNAAKLFNDLQQRQVYLAAACTGHPELRQRIEHLLDASKKADDFFQRNAAPGLGELAPSQPELTRLIAVPEVPGTVIGRYKLLQKLGEGGCGIVYMAEQTEPVRRRVALKVIKLGMDTKQVIARFEAERQALAMMDHPNIAKVFDAGATETGRPYFVMELVRGIKITEYCDQHHLSTRQRLDLFIPVCQAIQHAHQKGIIHRDIKPSNILVTLHDGVPVSKVIDFGIAKATEGRLTDQTLFTAFEQFIGTPAYMSPEQAEMSGLDIDTRSDIYSLGVLLYELLTGRTPLDAKELVAAGLDELRRTIREKDPMRPSTRLRSLLEAEQTTAAKRRGVDVPKLIHLLSGDLDWIVMKCLEKDRTRRYETANGLAVDIQRHLQNEPVVARPPSRLYRSQKMVCRNKLAFGAATAVAAALVFGIVISSWQAVRAEHERRVAQANYGFALAAKANEAKQRQLADEKRREAEERAREQRRLLYVGDMSQAFQAIKEGNLGLATSLMTNYLHQPEGEDLRGWEWRYLWQLCQPSEHKILAHSDQAMNSVVFSPDGRLLATAGPDRTVRVFEVDSYKPVTNLSGFNGKIYSRALAFSPDGRFLAAKGDQIMRAWNTKTWQEVFHQTIGVAPNWIDELNTVLFSPDGTTLATKMQTASNEKGIGFWDVQSGRLLLRLDSPDYSLGLAMKYSPDGKMLALASFNKLQVHESRSLSSITNLIQDVPFGGYFESIVFSGNLMAAGYRMGQIKIWDTRTWAELASWRAHPRFLEALDFSPDGKLLASGASDCRIQVWDLATVLKAGINAATIRPQTTLQGHTDRISSVMFAPDGRSIASCSMDGTVRLWSLPSPDQPISLFKAKPADDKLDWWFLEDGKHAVYADTNLHFFVADLSGATAPRPLKGAKGAKGEDQLAVSPDGKTLGVRKFPDDSIQLWNLETGELKIRIQGARRRPLTGPPSSLALAGGGLFVSSDDDAGEIRIQDLSAEQKEIVLKTTPGVLSSITLSGDGRVLAARLSRTQIGFWSLPDGHSLGAIDVPRSLNLNWEQLALSQDGYWLAYCSTPEKSLVLWDLVSPQSRKSPVNNVTSTWASMAFAPDGKTLVLATNDGSVFFWNVATMREIMMDENLAVNYSTAKFSANGEYLALPLRLLRAPPLAEIEATERAKAQRGLAALKEASK